MPAPTPPHEPVHTYPGGEDAPAYRWAFTLWVVLFLGAAYAMLIKRDA